MPTYHYVCEKCEGEFELMQPMTSEPLKTCTKEKCCQKRWGKGRVRRAISGGAGLIFKGTGFYITDYRSENYKAGAKKDSAASAAPATSSETKKPEAKSTAKKPATGSSS